MDFYTNSITDISAVSHLTNLKLLDLTNNSITDISPLVSNNGLGQGDEVHVRGNPLNAVSLNTHIPELQSRGVDVKFDAVISTDVNDDGVVNVADIVFILSNWEETGENAADVNKDGIVDIADLTLAVNAMMENGNGAVKVIEHAPTLQASAPQGITATDVQRLLRHVRERALRNPAYLRSVVVLEHLLTLFIPKKTMLLANYPNPLNPETWIPYQLIETADVSIRIYDVRGSLIRHLPIGHQPAGFYQGKDRAAYWDGRNQLGEPVASGVYFYTLMAGDFTATRNGSGHRGIYGRF